MKIRNVETYKAYYVIEKNDCGITGIIASDKGRLYSTKYLNDDKDILVFYKLNDAKKWIKENSYNGMSFYYEIKLIEFNKGKWRIA